MKYRLRSGNGAQDSAFLTSFQVTLGVTVLEGLRWERKGMGIIYEKESRLCGQTSLKI